jgi:predicted ATPase/DNA-binding NarL/FixJ family response regulator
MGPGAASHGGTITPFRAFPRGRERASGVPAPADRSSLREWRHNLPHPIASFIGREQEIVEATRLLATTRLLTLTGAGGVGKTRLSHEIAAGLVDPSAAQHSGTPASPLGPGGAPSADSDQAYPDGVWLVELAALDDATLVPQAVANVLGVREEPDRPLTATLADALRAERLLLVLDNCEHLVEACAALAEGLLRSCPGLRILATSRQALGVTGETTLRVPSLSLPTVDDGPSTMDRPEPGAGRPACPKPVEGSTVDHLLEAEAARLFVERARAVQPTFVLTEGNAAAVAEVCRRLDGIPLAIELAAARVAVLSPAQLAARLGDRFRLLTGGSRMTLPRYRTLRALVDWSHDLLDERERALFRRLAVFAGGWTLEAAEAIAGLRTEGTANSVLSTQSREAHVFSVLDVLAGLVDKSLILAEERVGEVRYRFLETLREYATEKLHEAGEEATLRERHCDWFVALAERAEPELSGPHQEAWLDRLDHDRENLRAARRWAEARGDAETVVRLGAALWQFWWARADAAEAREWVDATLPLARSAAPVPARARALHGAGALAMRLGDHAASRTLLEEATSVARRLGDRRTLAHVLGSLGRLEFFRGRYAESRTVLDECLAISRAVDDRGALIRALSRRGFVEYIEGRQESARALFGEGLALAREAGDHAEVGELLNNLGNAHHVEGDLDRAIGMYREALTVWRKVGDGNGLAWALNDLGHALALRGEPEAARDALREALTLARRMGNRRRLAFTLGAAAMLAAATGQAERAVRLGAAAEAAVDAIGAVQARAMRELWAARVGSARRALGERAAAPAGGAGRALTLEQAVDEALAWLGEPESSAHPGERPGREDPSGGAGLSPRELEVAALVARGLSNRQIADELVITSGTANNHVKHILAKLGLESRVQIAAWAIERGLHRRSPS